MRSLSFWRDASAGGVDAARVLARRAVAAFHAYVWNEISRALWMPWAMIALKFGAVVAVCLYLSMAAILYFTQRSMMYFPDPVHTSPGQAGLSEAQEVELKAADGEYSLAWHVAPRQDRPVILYFHGNGGAFATASSASARLSGTASAWWRSSIGATAAIPARPRKPA